MLEAIEREPQAITPSPGSSLSPITKGPQLASNARETEEGNKREEGERERDKNRRSSSTLGKTKKLTNTASELPFSGSLTTQLGA
jgi:hypothetical protein